MKKNMTNYELVQIVNTMKGLANKKYPQKVSYTLMKTIVALEKESEIYTKQLEALVKEYQEADKIVLDKDRKPILNESGLPQIKKEYAEDFGKELTELLNFIVEIELPTIKADNLDYSDEKYDILTPAELILIMNLICDE